MITINSSNDFVTAFENHVHEAQYNGKTIYIVYSKNDVQDAIDKGCQYIYPGTAKMQAALKFITRHQKDIGQEMDEKMGVDITGVILVALVGLGVLLILGLVAILKNTETEIIKNADGSFTIKTKRQPKE